MSGAPDFWEDREKAQEVITRLSFLRQRIDAVKELEEMLSEVEVLLELGEEEEEEEALQEALKISRRLRKEYDSLSLALMLQGKFDANNAILALHPGAGGTESQDWAEMLLRMYTRWAEKRKFEVEILDLLPGDEAGIKSVTLLVKGAYAYGYLRSERGVHRLVRISPFDAGGRRHTSFASVDVLPEVEESQEAPINPEDLKIDTYRSKGAGGQHVNTTDSAVRITHLPTGLVVTCQNERSQHSNRDRALRILRARLADLHQREQEESLRQLRGEQKEIAWGSQIRSYVLHPYTMAKDHRTQVEVGNTQGVLDGDLDSFMEAFLRLGLR
jgi:peptide chain release factor 2